LMIVTEHISVDGAWAIFFCPEIVHKLIPA
jgi:hypothetical protein